MFQNDPDIFVAKFLMPIWEGIVGAHRLAINLIKAPFIVVNNFINRK